MTGNVGEGTLGVAELAEGHVVGLITCEGGEDVVGVVTPLVRGGAQVFAWRSCCRVQCAARSA